MPKDKQEGKSSGPINALAIKKAISRSGMVKEPKFEKKSDKPKSGMIKKAVKAALSQGKKLPGRVIKASVSAVASGAKADKKQREAIDKAIKDNPGLGKTLKKTFVKEMKK